MIPLVDLVTALLAMTSPACPPQVVRIYPDEGAAHRQVERIGADLDLTIDPGADLASLRLIVDGEDVTSRASVVATRDWPPSRVWISHAAAGVAPGSHRVEIRFQSRDGRAMACAWTFVSQP